MDLNKGFQRSDFEIYLERCVEKATHPPYLKKIKKRKRYNHKELNTVFNTYLKVNLFKLIDAIHKSGYEDRTHHLFTMKTMSPINNNRMEIVDYAFTILNDNRYAYETIQTIYDTKKKKNITTNVNTPLKYVDAMDITVAKNELYFWYTNRIVYTEMSQINKNIPLQNKICTSVNYSYIREISENETYRTDIFDLFNSDGISYDAKDSFIFKSVDVYEP